MYRKECRGSVTNVVNCPALAATGLGVVSIASQMFTRTGANLALNPPLSNAFDKSTIPYYNVYFSDTEHEAHVDADVRPGLRLGDAAH